MKIFFNMNPASLTRVLTGALRRKTAYSFVQKNFARNGSVTTWNKDWKPGPYPRTEEERIAAAKKYNMLPEDYTPYPEEEGFGDYPMFENYHAETRDPFAPYDYQFLKRHYGEPMHPDFDMTLEDRVNFQEKMKIPFWKQMVYLFCMVTGYTGMCVLSKKYAFLEPAIPKQDPFNEQVHYTFESED